MNTVQSLNSASELADKQSEAILDMTKQEWRGGLFTMDRSSIDPTQVSGMRANIATVLETILGNVDAIKQQDLLIGGMTTLRSFLQTKDIITAVDPDGLCDLVRISFESCLDTKGLSDLEMRIGYGAADLSEPNARTLAYTVPAIRILKSLQENRELIAKLAAAEEEGNPISRKHIGKIRKNLALGRTLSENQRELLLQVPTGKEGNTPFSQALPQVIVYSAHNFISSTNTVDRKQVQTIVTQTQQAIGNFLGYYCPDIAQQFSFDSDRPIDPTSFEGVYTQYLGQILGSASTSDEQKARDQIIQFGVKKSAGNIEGSLQYGAAHALYSGDVFDGPAIQILQNTKARPEKLLMIGGPPEQYFWRARSIVRSNARTEDAKAFFAQKGLPWEQEPVDTNGYARAQLITAIGELPVYGKGFNGEWGIREIASGLPFEEFLSGPARSSMRADMLQLVAEVAGIPPEKVQKVARKKEKDSTTLQQFADGFTKLQQLLQS